MRKLKSALWWVTVPFLYPILLIAMCAIGCDGCTKQQLGDTARVVVVKAEDAARVILHCMPSVLKLAACYSQQDKQCEINATAEFFVCATTPQAVPVPIPPVTTDAMFRPDRGRRSMSRNESPESVDNQCQTWTVAQRSASEPLLLQSVRLLR